jgi:hypothetical protein
MSFVEALSRGSSWEGTIRDPQGRPSHPLLTVERGEDVVVSEEF